jgi:hypothetical protein
LMLVNHRPQDADQARVLVVEDTDSNGD